MLLVLTLLIALPKHISAEPIDGVINTVYSSTVHQWPQWKPGKIDGVEHRCVDLKGYKELRKIHIDYVGMHRDAVHYEVRLGHKNAQISELKSAIQNYDTLTSVLQGEVDYLQLSLNNYKESVTSKNKFAIIREVSLWVIVLGELTAILFISSSPGK